MGFPPSYRFAGATKQEDYFPSGLFLSAGRAYLYRSIPFYGVHFIGEVFVLYHFTEKNLILREYNDCFSRQIHKLNGTISMFGFPGWIEITIILGIILLLFGKRLPGVMNSLGKSIVEFKKGAREGAIEDEKDSQDANQDNHPS